MQPGLEILTNDCLVTISFVMFSVFVHSLLLQIILLAVKLPNVYPILSWHPSRGGRGFSRSSAACYVQSWLNDYKMINRVFHSDDDPVDCCTLLPPSWGNSFWFYSWTRLDYCESLDLLVPGSREDDNREFRVVTALPRCHKILGTPGPHFHNYFGDPFVKLGIPP